MDLLPASRPAVEAHLRRLGWLASDEPLLRLTPAGEDTGHRSLRAETPTRTFILKQAMAGAGDQTGVTGLEVEHAFYRAIAGTDALAIRAPRVLGSDPAHGLLCLTDLGSGPSLVAAYGAPETLRGDQQRADGTLTALVYWLWKLHALPVTTLAGMQVFRDRNLRLRNHARIFTDPLATATPAPLSPALQALHRQFAADATLAGRAQRLGAIYLGDAGHDSAPALLHGNYCPESWLRHPRMGVTIVGPASAFLGPPELDVGMFLAHLTLAGLHQSELAMLMGSYVTPPGFSYPLALGFAGMEIIRRLLGVAQLPLTVDDAIKLAWLQTAREMVLN